jgi:hypothetical protein
MKTFKLYFPNKFRAKLMIEVDSDGLCLRVLKRDFISGRWISGTECLLTPEIKEAIDKDVADLKWEYEAQNYSEKIRRGLMPA